LDSVATNGSSDNFLVSTSQVNADGVHVWPFDPVCPVDVVQHSLSGRHPFRMNRHDYFEFVFLRSGSVEWQVQGSHLSQAEGELFVMTHPKYHRVTEHSCFEAYAESLFFHPQLIASAWGSDFRFLGELFSSETGLAHVFPAKSRLPAEVLSLIRQISRELPAKDARARLTVKTYLKMLLVLLMNQSGMAARPITEGRDRRQAALDSFKPLFMLLEERYREAMTPNEAARAMHMSPSNFRRAFKMVTGQSFVSYLNNFRVAKAQELLTGSDMPIAEVGLETGFCDQSYFGMIFRRLTQATPRQYRQQSRQTGAYETKKGTKSRRCSWRDQTVISEVIKSQESSTRLSHL
jgi:AraC-like DNA-binding protein